MFGHVNGSISLQTFPSGQHIHHGVFCNAHNARCLSTSCCVLEFPFVSAIPENAALLTGVSKHQLKNTSIAVDRVELCYSMLARSAAQDPVW